LRLKRKVIGIHLLAAAVPLTAADPVEEVRQAEIAFAKAFADRDAAKFFSFVADDATFLGGLSTHWSQFFKSAEAPFSWGPDRVAVNASGTLGLSTGPVFDPQGKHSGSYMSTWVKQPDGTWKILFDGSGPSAAPFAEDAVKVEEGFLTTADGVKLHYRKAGSGPVTLIIPLEFVMFDDFRQLADVATVISYDLRNRGRSQAVKNPTIQNDVDDLETVRKHFNVEKFVPIGYSYLGTDRAARPGADARRRAGPGVAAPRLRGHGQRSGRVPEVGRAAESRSRGEDAARVLRAAVVRSLQLPADRESEIRLAGEEPVRHGERVAGQLREAHRVALGEREEVAAVRR
jgi:ketosteroid isomerase-like protein